MLNASPSATPSFQSSPARGGGCNPNSSPVGSSTCWFQSSPARGGGCNCGLCAYGWHVAPCFNPHPPVGAGATWVAQAARRVRPRFNPHPPVGAGATCGAIAHLAQASPVSILTRPWGRVQRRLRRSAGVVAEFQSSPARGGGCNLPSRARHPPFERGFNPHPPVGAGATQQIVVATTRSTRSFNPHPPVGAGAM